MAEKSKISVSNFKHWLEYDKNIVVDAPLHMLFDEDEINELLTEFSNYLKEAKELKIENPKC